MMKRAETLDATESILKRAGFQLSERCVARPSCFDLVARREKQLALIKVPVNVGSIYAKDASELQSISRCFSAALLFIGETSRDQPLEDDTVYSRYNIYTINLRTLEDITCRKICPLVEAGPGGYYVKLDGDTKASVSVAYKLEWILGIPLVHPIDVFQSGLSGKGFLAAAKRMIIRNRFLKAVLRRFSHFDISATPTERAPFDFIVQFPEEHLNIIGGVTDGKEQDVDQRTKEIVSVSKVIEARPVFITDGHQAPNNDIPLICYKELMGIRYPKEFIDLL